MMNFSLNLLPTGKKNHLETTMNFLLIKNIVELFLLVVASLTATLIWSWLFLEDDFASLTQSALLINRESYSYNQDAKNINNLIRDINLASKGFSPVSPKLKDLSSSLPNDIKLSSLQIDTQAQKIIINGTAISRSALLNYEDILSHIPWITNVETPVSQLFQKENINFEFHATLKNPTAQH